MASQQTVGGVNHSTNPQNNHTYVFNVRTKPDNKGVAGKGAFKDLAYTGSPIGFHTDNPYREPVPDFQLLHAIEHCTVDPEKEVRSETL